MDIKAFGGKIVDFLKKYRYVVLVLVIGIVLMALPTGQRQNAQPQTGSPQTDCFTDPTEELKGILSQIRGAGKVQVMLTLNGGERTVYQTDRDTDADGNGTSVRVETVIVTGSNREQTGLTQQVLAPVYRGAIIVCQGADNAQVRLAIVEAVSDVTGLGADRISVLKMK